MEEQKKLTLTEAMSIAWKELASHDHDTIGVRQYAELVDRTANILGLSRYSILNQEERKQMDEKVEIFGDQVDQMTRKEFQDLFELVTTKEFKNSMVLHDNENDDNDGTNSTMSIEDEPLIEITEFNTSTPLRPKKHQVPYKFNDNNNHNNDQTETRRSPKDIKLLEDQEDMIKRFESQVSELDKEKVRLNTELRNAKAQIRDLQSSEKEKDTHIQYIENEIHKTQQQLQKSKRPSPPPAPTEKIIYRPAPEQDQIIQGLKQQVEQLTKQRQQVLDESERLAKQMVDATNPNTLQKLHVALDRQKRMLANVSSAKASTPPPSTQTFTMVRSLGVLLLLYFIIGAISRFNSAEGTPWWEGSMFHQRASRFNAWVQEPPIS